jgi:DNA replication protein DnaC
MTKPISLPQIPGLPRSIEEFQLRAAAALAEMRRVRAEDCPRCTRADDDVAVACRSRGSPALPEDGIAACRWTPAVNTSVAERERVQLWTDRLKRRGCENRRISQVLARSAEAPLPPLDWFDSDEDEHAYRLARKAVIALHEGRSRLPVLVLEGVTGSGKSALAAWVLAQAESARWVNAVNAAATFDAWKSNRPAYASATLNVIDDMGLERDTEGRFAIESLAEYVAWRCDAELPTIITTNLSLDDGPRGEEGFRRRYGVRCDSRVTLAAEWLCVGNTDLRRSAARATGGAAA